MMSTAADGLHPVVPGGSIEGDWYRGVFPSNIEVGEETLTDSTHTFKNYRSLQKVGFRCGSNVTLWRASISVEENGYVEIGDNSYLANASLVAADRITIGARVFIAGGVTIVDSDFHPVDPALRLADTIALSPGGDRSRRPPIETRAVEIGNDVWIGYNAIILKGVRIGDGALIQPGSVVLHDVQSNSVVAGNPASRVEA